MDCDRRTKKKKKKGSSANQDIIVIGIFSTFVPRVRNVREDDRDISVIRICRLIDALLNQFKYNGCDAELRFVYLSNWIGVGGIGWRFVRRCV